VTQKGTRVEDADELGLCSEQLTVQHQGTNGGEDRVGRHPLRLSVHCRSASLLVGRGQRQVDDASASPEAQSSDLSEQL
jgi:hypothetical protein